MIQIFWTDEGVPRGVQQRSLADLKNKATLHVKMLLRTVLAIFEDDNTEWRLIRILTKVVRISIKDVSCGRNSIVFRAREEELHFWNFTLNLSQHSAYSKNLPSSAAKILRYISFLQAMRLTRSTNN